MVYIKQYEKNALTCQKTWKSLQKSNSIYEFDKILFIVMKNK